MSFFPTKEATCYFIKKELCLNFEETLKALERL